MKNSPPGGQEISTAQPEDARHWDILRRPGFKEDRRHRHINVAGRPSKESVVQPADRPQEEPDSPPVQTENRSKQGSTDSGIAEKRPVADQEKEQATKEATSLHPRGE